MKLLINSFNKAYEVTINTYIIQFRFFNYSQTFGIGGY